MPFYSPPSKEKGDEFINELKGMTSDKIQEFIKTRWINSDSWQHRYALHELDNRKRNIENKDRIQNSFNSKWTLRIAVLALLVAIISLFVSLVK